MTEEEVIASLVCSSGEAISWDCFASLAVTKRGTASSLSLLAVTKEKPRSDKEGNPRGGRKGLAVTERDAVVEGKRNNGEGIRGDV